jgi:hypothetical protein
MLEIIGILITLIAGYIGWNGKRLIDRIDRFERIVQDLIVANVGDKKDIEILRRDVDGHEVRITNLEK